MMKYSKEFYYTELILIEKSVHYIDNGNNEKSCCLLTKKLIYETHFKQQAEIKSTSVKET